MRTIESLLAEYGESHQNPTNKMVHWVCVPTIVFSVIGLLYGVKFGDLSLLGLPVNLATVVLTLALLYYIRVSPTLAVGFLLFALICLYLCGRIEQGGAPLWRVCLILFVVAWIGQFWGHKVEGKKPSFLKDVQFLLIGPAWLLSFIYARLGIPV
ncbi:MAG TPA: DUF962 domain-containing protein [Saprospiraceae bacterium]|nr:DUF962 domain-containing protein [Saprospiraceae bacterium]HNG89385.1 DUF962 domain-containing protein [Saprospiraceae bacterium]